MHRVDWDAADGRNVRSPADGLGNSDGDGKIRLESIGRKSRSLGHGPGEGLRAGQSSCGVGLGDALQLPKEDLAGAVQTWPFCQGLSGVVCFYVLYRRMH